MASVLILSCYCCARIFLSRSRQGLLGNSPSRSPISISFLHLCPRAADACLRLPPPGGLTRHWLTGLLTLGSQFVGKLFPVIINPSCVRGGYSTHLCLKPFHVFPLHLESHIKSSYELHGPINNICPLPLSL